MLRFFWRNLGHARALLALLAVLFAAAPVTDAFACGTEPLVAESVLVCADLEHAADLGDAGHASHGACQHGHCDHANGTPRGDAGSDGEVGGRPPAQLPLDSVPLASLAPRGLKRPPKG
jgi:hypothetical protein